MPAVRIAHAGDAEAVAGSRGVPRLDRPRRAGRPPSAARQRAAACSPTRTPSSCWPATRPTGVCQLRYRHSVWTGTRRLLHRGRVRPRARARQRPRAGARGRGARARHGNAAAPACELDTGESNAPALALYRSFGFESGTGAPGERDVMLRLRVDALQDLAAPGAWAVVGISPATWPSCTSAPTGDDHPLPRRPAASCAGPVRLAGHARRARSWWTARRSRSAAAGSSRIRPLCDGTHKLTHFRAPSSSRTGAQPATLGGHARRRGAASCSPRFPARRARASAQRRVERGERARTPERRRGPARAAGAPARRPGPPPRCSRARRRPPRARRRTAVACSPSPSRRSPVA